MRTYVIGGSGSLNFMFNRCFGVSACLLLLILFVFQFLPFAFAVTVNEAAKAIEQAKSDLDSTFTAVAEAENAGADVSALLVKLNLSGDFLTHAQLAFRGGDYEGALSYASASSYALLDIKDEATRLRLDAEKARINQLAFSVGSSAVSLLLLVIIGLLGWKSLTKWYFKRILNMKPEVGVKIYEFW